MGQKRKHIYKTYLLKLLAQWSSYWTHNKLVRWVKFQTINDQNDSAGDRFNKDCSAHKSCCFLNVTVAYIAKQEFMVILCLIS